MKPKGLTYGSNSALPRWNSKNIMHIQSILAKGKKQNTVALVTFEVFCVIRTWPLILQLTNVCYYRWQEAPSYSCQQKPEENMRCASYWETPTYTATNRRFAIQKKDLNIILPHSNIRSSDLWFALCYKRQVLFCCRFWSIFGFDSWRTV